MPEFVAFLLIFVFVGVFFVFFHLMLGSLIRPRTSRKEDAEKFTIYECGEPTIGSAWVQFDLRFYVIALLFVIFDVEVAFFFPWAVVFGKANTLANTHTSKEQRITAINELVPPYAEHQAQLAELKQASEKSPEDLQKRREELRGRSNRLTAQEARELQSHRIALDHPKAASGLAWLAFWDIAVFFGVLLVGFAYLWKRGDLHWVRSLLAERAAESSARAEEPALAGAARNGS